MANPYDNASVVSMDIPLFIRVLEIARESVKDDAALHRLVERCIKAQTEKSESEPLTMDDYAAIDEGDSESESDEEDGVLSSVLSRLSLHE